MISIDINGFSLSFETKQGLFSPAAADRGTLAMLAEAEHYTEIYTHPRLCDLGCGYGLAGIYLAKRYDGSVVHMIDNDPVAVACAQANVTLNGVENAQVFVSDGFTGINETGYDMILCNPPYHSDFSVAKRFIEKGFNRLRLGGTMLFVTKRREWYKNKFVAVFGGVKVTEKDGYYVFMAEKRGSRYGNK